MAIRTGAQRRVGVRRRQRPPANPGQPHRWTSEEASRAGHLGGLAKAKQDRDREAHLERLTHEDTGEGSEDAEKEAGTDG